VWRARRGGGVRGWVGGGGGGGEEEPENAASHGWFLDGYKS